VCVYDTMGCEEIQSHLVQAKRMDLIFLVLFITNFGKWRPSNDFF